MRAYDNQIYRCFRLQIYLKRCNNRCFVFNRFSVFRIFCRIFAIESFNIRMSLFKRSRSALKLSIFFFP